MAIKTHTLLNKIVPELIDILDKRYTMLRTISVFQPIGRRNLSNYMGIGERIIRSDTYILRDAGLIEMDLAGMTLTREGEDLLEKLGGFLNELKGLADMETKIAEYLNIKNVIIVPGNLDEDKLVSNEIGKAAAIFLSRNMPRRGIVAVTGGSSVGAVAKSLGRIGKFPDLMLVPARGGIGREVDYQSNTIVSIFAKKWVVNIGCCICQINWL